MYIEPDGDRVIDVFEEPAPYLRVEKQGFDELTQDGNARYRIKVWNDGSAPAENVILTDAMDGHAPSIAVRPVLAARIERDWDAAESVLEPLNSNERAETLLMVLGMRDRIRTVDRLQEQRGY